MEDWLGGGEAGQLGVSKSLGVEKFKKSGEDTGLDVRRQSEL